MPDEFSSGRFTINPDLFLAGGQFTTASATNLGTFVDVGAAVSPTVTRAGRVLPHVEIDPAVFDHVLIPLQPLQQVRVVAQTPPAGTRLPRGATVDLVLAPVGQIPFDVFKDTHADFKGRALGDLQPVLADARVRDIVDRNATGKDVSAGDREFLVGQLRQSGVEIRDEDPQRSFDRAFQTVKGATAFQ
ncbi:MAG TPA: PASTA domain-containing protein [Thermoanaerobaculia bacterium]|nr:PASTA domain-containing protein [Thermoanaerobaculia bacterium]